MCCCVRARVLLLHISSTLKKIGKRLPIVRVFALTAVVSVSHVALRGVCARSYSPLHTALCILCVCLCVSFGFVSVFVHAFLHLLL